MTIVRSDTFTRANVASGGWGTATDGNPWTLQSGTASTLSVASNEGTVTSTSSSDFVTLGAALPGADGEGLLRWLYPSGSTSTNVGILLRWTDANNHWLARYDQSNGGVNVMVKVSGTYTAQSTIAFTPTAGAFHWLRFRAQGTTISLKVWKDGTTEPSSWSGQYTLTQQNVAGSVGVYAFSTGSNPLQVDSFSVDNLASSVTGSATIAGAGSLTASGAVQESAKIAGHGNISASGYVTLTAAATIPGKGALAASTGTPGTGIGGLAVTTGSLAWTGGPTGSPGTETRVTYTDSQQSGWAVGLVPGYGGMPISPVYSVDAGTATQETSLSTSNPDGHIHWLEQNTSGTFGGSEDVKFTLTELAPTGTTFRRYFQAVGNTADALGFTWKATACIYPGDPGMIAYRFDLTNPGASAISLNATDSLEVALLAGLEQTDTTWAPANGGYGTIAGSDTVGWPASLTNIEPDYVYITPAAGGNTTLGQATVKKTSMAGLGWTNLQTEYLQNASRLKIKTQGSYSSFPAGATQTMYFLQVLRRNITASDVRAIAASYLSPGTPTTSVGSFSSFSYDEAIYVFAAGSGNRLSATLDMSGTGVTTRYKPRYKITGWTDTSAPLLSWGGATLVANTDYRTTYDATNSVLYLQLYFDVVSGAAGTGQRTNAALAVAPSVLTGAATLPGRGTLAATPGALTYSAAAALRGHGSLSASGTQTLTGAATLPGHGTLAASGTQGLTGGAHLAGHGALAASGGQVLTGAAHLAGHGSLSASGLAGTVGAATISGQGRLAASGTQVLHGAATVAGQGALQVSSGAQVLTGAASISGAGHLTASGVQLLTGAAHLAGHGSVAASGLAGTVGSATIPGTGHLTASGVQLLTGTARLSGRGTLTASVQLQHTGAATLRGLGALVAAGSITPGAGVRLRGAAVSATTSDASAVTATTRGAATISATVAE